MRLRMRAAATALLVCVALLRPGPSQAEDASPWQEDKHSSVRLLAGSRSGATLLGGIAFQLEPGWKTYWRTPGDSGVPPRFDFSKSENIESVTVLWPAPMAFDDGAGGVSYGYKGDLVLPLRIAVKANDKPVTLRAAISYAVCEKLCLPVDAQAELVFNSVASSQDGILFAALDTVPKPVAVGDAATLAIRGVRREGRRVIVDVSAPGEVRTDLFVEGPTPDWALPAPKQVARSGDTRRYEFELDGLPSGARPEGAALKLTLTGGGRAIETAANLD
jgi:DsbC/DsbD-like thiol-disulfide interchange protein